MDISHVTESREVAVSGIPVTTDLWYSLYLDTFFKIATDEQLYLNILFAENSEVQSGKIFLYGCWRFRRLGKEACSRGHEKLSATINNYCWEVRSFCDFEVGKVQLVRDVYFICTKVEDQENKCSTQCFEGCEMSM